MAEPGLADVVARLRAAGSVFAEEEAALLLAAAPTAAELEETLGRRVAGEPLELVLGWVDLEGVRVALEASVFVPRRRSGLLVREAARLARSPAVVVDLCCGSGALGAALLARVGGLDLHAADVDPAAVRCARRNLGPTATVHRGDLFAALPRELAGRVGLVLANAPYVPTREIATMPPEARDHEPLVALDGGADGLDVHRRIAADAGAWLAPGGHLVLETSARQAARTAALVAAAGLAARVVRDADLDATVVVGTAR
ncbi:putative protein N(5)-glutamine methyltransferase [Georgenia muralis]|uniref:Release factor glutamine methyltransferase n=1 Tax=Georgenia muralis TaxID=154117 RepID=A0A3N4Z244_9MICO|nr:putative protein N(5)-glutamine methyltransferase [Georgenia muralis]RPF25686.1 release factor glutamine methyltransferase [Georgenia muralis]